MLKSAGADINALTYRTYGVHSALALFEPQKAIMTDMIARTPALLASQADHMTYAMLSDVSDTLRLLTDSMDFLDADGNGWLVLSRLYEGVSCIGGETEAQSALLLWMLKLLTYELKAYYIRSKVASLLDCTLCPFPGLEPASNLLLKLGDAKIIDAQDGIDGYTVLHTRLAYALDPRDVGLVLSKGPNLHLLGFDDHYTLETESPMSLAMYSSWAFADWLHGLVAIGVDLGTFVDQELKNNALIHHGWEQETLHDIFDYPARPDLCFRDLRSCADCGMSTSIVRVQPYWRHLLERIKQRIDPDDPFWRDSGVDETQISNIKSGMEASNDSDHEPDIPGSVSLDDTIDKFQLELESGVELGFDVHGYPENVPIQSDCIYDPDEIVCMECWLYYRWTGTRFEVEDSWMDECPSEDESSDDEFSPYHIHS